MDATSDRQRVASPGLITAREALSWATIGGAEVAGIADRTGSLTPGKKADVVIIDGSAVNVAPIIDPVGAIVCAADISNVKTVLVDGEALKEDFKLKTSLDAPRRAVEASRDYLLDMFGDPEPGWLTGR
jgi:cytosine/adenosine deaminase-related metal-dependent hydrolase